MRQFILVMTLLTKFALVNSQDYPSREYDLEKLAEYIFPAQDLDIDYSQLYENLAQILSNPIDLNQATDEQLRSLYLLNEIQIANLVAYRDSQGPFISIYELQSISGFDQNTLDMLIPFVTIKSTESDLSSLSHRILNERNNYLLLRYNRTLETKKGYSHDPVSTTNYIGSADRIYSRFRVARAGDFSLGYTLEKDAGEKLSWSPSNKQYGFDYNSLHAQVLDKGIVSNLILGDFQSQFGQGLVLGGGFGVGKGAETIATIRRSNTGFLPYTSLNEAGFFRGAAISLKPTRHLSVNTFFSKNWKDGTANSDTTGLSLSSISSSGLHRTQTEIANRKAFQETNYGAVVSFKNRALEIGAILHQTHFSIPILRNSTTYNQFFFEGSRNTNTSVYLNYTLNNMTFFSEAAYTFNHGKALVLGALTSLTQQFDLALLYRHYDRNFQTFYGNAFSENTTAQNESGYYLGWKYKFNKQHTLAGYSDLFQFPWLRYRGYAPSSGHEWLARYSFQPSKEVFFYIQAREESKIRNHSADATLYSTENGLKRNYWVNLDYSVSRHISFKSRVQFSSFSFNKLHTSGFAIIQDVNFKINKITFSTRYALFDTDDFDNRQYVYERDVWLAYSFPFYNGQGVRSYALIQYALNEKIDLWLRWSRIMYVDREIIGSGSETIDKNSMNDIKFQARIRF